MVLSLIAVVLLLRWTEVNKTKKYVKYILHYEKYT